MNKNFNPHLHNLNIMKNTVPKMAFDAEMPLEIWQAQAREKLSSLLGLDKFVKCEPNFNIEYITEDENMHEIRFSFQSEEGYYVLCHFCYPKNAKLPAPLVICLQGHSMGMHVSFSRTLFEGETGEADEGDRGFVLQVIANGYSALTIEQRNFGECGGTDKGPDCYKSTMAALMLGRTTLAERVWDVMRAIDVVSENFEQADCENIGIMGNSGGGTTTYYAACLEDRIKIAMPSCSICTFDDSIAAIPHCSCNFVPSIRNYFNMADLAGLILPKKLIIVAGEEDDIFPIEGVKKSFEQILNIYSSAGIKDYCRLIVGKGGHRFYAADAWPVYKELLSL